MNNFKSSLFDQDTFYNNFLKDISKAKSLVLIESPFITEKRLALFIPIFKKLIKHGVHIVINTKPIEEHNPLLQDQVLESIGLMQSIGVDVYMTVGHHRKLAVIDKSILWEGSLNILSQYDSCEVMRRIRSKEWAKEVIELTGFDVYSK